MMITVEQLRQSLAANADRAPDAIGLVAGARAGAARVGRRRRRMAVAGTAALTVCAVAAATVLRWPDGEARPGAVVAESVAPPYRGPLQLTVDLPNHGVITTHGLFKMSEGSDGPIQFMNVSSNVPAMSAMVAVVDPGAFDSTALLHGQRITVAGHPAYYVSDLLLGTQPRPPAVPGKGAPAAQESSSTGTREIREPAIGWRDVSGAWVIVFSSVLPEGLPAIAEAVLLGPPRGAVAPFRLSHPPAGLRYEYLHAGGVPGTAEVDVRVGFGIDNGSSAPRRQLVDVDQLARTTMPLLIEALDPNEPIDTRLASLHQTPVPVAGHNSWYVTSGIPGWLIPAGGANLVVHVGACYFSFNTSDQNRMPYEAVKRVVEGTQFANCTDRSAWFPIP